MANLVQSLQMLASFVATRYRARVLKDRAAIERFQSRKLAQFLKHTVPAVTFYQGKRATRLQDLPIIDKSILMQHFDSFNRPGITAAEGWEIFAGKATRPGYSVGASTGTSGNRGLFVISDAERFRWLGVMIAKTLPNFPFETARVALALPLNTSLYDAARDSGRLPLQFFDLHDGVEAVCRYIIACQPDTVIAPPKVLRHLAVTDETLKLKRIFSAAEVLDPLDRQIIERRFGLVVREIYMATEGLLGVACEFGTLHLAEDVMHFELQKVDDLVSPVISDLTRTTQVMARYRMNDLLRLRTTPCPCGSAFQAVAAIEGRCDDMFSLDALSGGKRVPLTPDILRNAIVDADRRIKDFRLVQTGPNAVVLLLPDALEIEATEAALAALTKLFARLGCAPTLTLRQEPLTVSVRKLRRIERQWKEAP